MLKVVTMVEPVGGHGGNEFYDFGLCEYLARSGVTVNLYTCCETRLDTKHSFSFRVNKFFRGIYGDGNKLLRGARYLVGSLRSALHSKRAGAQIAHFHIYHFSVLELLNVLLFKLSTGRVVCTIHDVQCFERYGSEREAHIGWKTRLILKLSDRLIVHSQFAYRSLVEIGVPQQRLSLVPHGDTDFVYNHSPLDRGAARRKLGIGHDDLLVLFFGQIKAVKGLDVLLRSVPHLRPEVRVLVVGKCWKQEIASYNRIVEELKIGDRVEFVNEFVENEDVPCYFWASDIVCLPYKKIYSSGVLYRAMDYRSAVVCSDLEPFKLAVEHRQTAMIFRSEDPESLARNINELAQDEELRLRLRDQAKERVDSNFAWPVVAQATRRVYDGLLA